MKASQYLIVGMIFGAVVVGAATRQRDIVILALPLVVYLFAAIYQRPDEVKLTVEREVSPEYAPQGTPITVKLTILNEGADLDEVRVQDILPSGVKQLEGITSTVTRLAAGGRIELEYVIAAHRGVYDTYEVLVEVSDFSNLFTRPLVYRTSPRLVVHPRYPKLDRVKIRPPQTRGFAGPIAARQGGTGVDFWGIREYQSGDSQRQINWKLAAQSEQELYTNIFEQERVADVGLILDARQRVNLVTSSGSLFEYAVRATAALAENFLDDGNRVSLMIYGAAVERVFPGYGKIHRERILKALSRANPGMNYALENLNSLPTRFFPAKSQIVLVSPLTPDDIPIILQMRAHGYAVIVISPDPIAYDAVTGNALDTEHPAYRLAYAEREFFLNRIRRSGVQVVNWQVHTPLEAVVRGALARAPIHYTVGR